MKLASTFGAEAEFRAGWAHAVDALQRLHEGVLVLPDYRYELAHDALQQSRSWTTAADIERVLRRFWAFDDRFLGEAPFGGSGGDFRWSVYSAAYLINDDRIAFDLLTVYCPLLGPFALKTFGERFGRMVCSTFADDVGHVLGDIQGIEAPFEPDFFDWHGHLNGLCDDARSKLLALAGIPLLEHPSFPPLDVMCVFCPMVSSPVHPNMAEAEYRQALHAFYEEIGHWDVAWRRRK